MNFFEIASFGIHESFFMGIFHGILFSLPLSIPFLISLRYFLLQGLSFGFTSLFGVLFGQFVFFVILCSGIRPLILLWYSLEPILAFIGVGLTFQLATNFYHQKKFFNLNTPNSLIGKERDGRGGFALPPAAQSLPQLGLGDGFMRLQIFGKTGLSVDRLEKIKIFFFQFCLIFLNPIFPALSTRIILTQDILTHFSLLYTSGFFIGSILCVGSFLFFLQSLYFLFTEAKLNSVGAASLTAGRSLPLGRGTRGEAMSQLPPASSRLYVSGGMSSGKAVPRVLFSVDTFSQFVNNCFVFCIIGLLLHGSFQYTWRFITHYPFEFFSIPIRDVADISQTGVLTSLGGGEKIASEITQSVTKPAVLVGDTKAIPYFREFLREFPTQDSNIRHREKTLPVERHLPIERINLRRNLSGRPPLNEEQKSDANTKYNSFFLNKIENIFENFKIRSRENIRSNLKVDLYRRESAGLGDGRGGFALPPASLAERSYAPGNVSGATGGEALPLARGWLRPREAPRPLVILLESSEALQEAPQRFVPTTTNKTKGKPQFSYIRHLFYAQTTSSGATLTSRVSSQEIALNPYIHDDLSVYYALSKM